MKSGWVSIHRKIKDHWLWENKPFSPGQAWIDILLECNHGENKVLIKGKLLTVKRGESLNSLKTWSERWGWSTGKVRHFLNLLNNDTMISMVNEHVSTRLTVINYDSYQNEQHAEKTQKDFKKISKRFQKNTNNNDNNINKYYLEIAERFRERKIKDGFDYKYIVNADLKKWAEEIDKLIRIDQQPIEEVKSVLKFALDDTFWKTNLFSLANLRKKSNSNDLTKYENILNKMNGHKNTEEKPEFTIDE